ncbi:exported protein of unknown function (plasmid) [Caballeronia sp. S22]
MMRAVSRWLLLAALWPPAVMAESPGPSPELLARGAYVAKAADCAGCHTAAKNGAACQQQHHTGPGDWHR